MSNKNKRTNEGGNARPDRAKLVGAGPLGSELSEILMLDEHEKVRDFFEQERQAADERSAAMRPAPQMIEGGEIELAAVPERLAPTHPRCFKHGEPIEVAAGETVRLEPGVHRIMGADYRTKYPVLLAVNESGGFKFKKPADAMSVDVEGVGAVPSEKWSEMTFEVTEEVLKEGIESDAPNTPMVVVIDKGGNIEATAHDGATPRDVDVAIACYKEEMEDAAERAKVGDVPFLPAQLRTEELNPYGFEPPATMQQVRALASGYQKFVIDLCRNAGSSARVGQVNLPGKDLAQLCAAIVGDPTAGHILKDETWGRDSKRKPDRATALRLLCRAAMNLPPIHPCGQALTQWAQGLAGPAGKELIPMAEVGEKLSLIAAALEGEHEEKSKAAAKLVTEAIKVLQ